MKLKSPWPWLLVALGCIALLFYAIHSSRPKLPIHQGRTLYQWADQLQRAQQDYSDPNRSQKLEEAQAAIRAMGTNALPFAMADVLAEISLKDRLTIWAAKRAPF